MPEIMMYCLKDISSIVGCSAEVAGILSTLMRVVVGDRISYHMGEYVFPWLDNQHSDVGMVEGVFWR